MKRYMVELKSQSKHDTTFMNTRREAIATAGRYLASTPEPCVIMILRKKKEVKPNGRRRYKKSSN